MFPVPVTDCIFLFSEFHNLQEINNTVDSTNFLP
jgi:hypothetical protein